MILNLSNFKVKNVRLDEMENNRVVETCEAVNNQVKSAAEEGLGWRKTYNKKEWITEEVVEKTQRRRKL